MASLRRYFTTMGAALYFTGVVAYLNEGQGLAAFVVSAIAILWMGWITIVAGLPVFALFLWLFPRARRRYPAISGLITGAAVGFALSAFVAVLLGGIGLAVGAPAPGAKPPLPQALVRFGAIVGGFGAVVGLVEARAARWSE